MTLNVPAPRKETDNVAAVTIHSSNINGNQGVLSNMKTFYLFAGVLGTVIPWLFFGSFFAGAGIDVAAFVTGLFANGPAAGFTADILISIMVFWLWSWHDARQHGVANWWLVLPAGLCVGLSLALPLYLFLRHDRATAMTT